MELHDLKRTTVPEMDSILGKPFEVLNGGFIRVIDYMGSDSAVVQAARVSYGEGTRTTHNDRGLIRYLMRHRHTTPFEMCEIKLHIRVPIDCWRQWTRHRTANINEYSTRYSVAIDSVLKTEPERWRKQSKSNKQGSEGYLPRDAGEGLSRREAELHERAREIYEERLETGVAREQARKDLPLSNFTEAYWKIDLHNLLHFIELRMDSHAQEEIRSYAGVIGREVVSRWCPLVWEAFLDYSFSSLHLTAIEVEIIRLIGLEDIPSALAFASEKGFLSASGEVKKSGEREELEEKLRKLNIAVPWGEAG